jgi:hypothetical protein
MDEALEKIKNLVLEDTETEVEEYVLERDNPMDCETSNARHVTEIKLNMYQLWAMFGQLPKVYEKGKSGLSNRLKFYEYIIRGRNTDIFTIYAWGHEKGFLHTKKWNIGATTKNKGAIQHFMDYLFLALKIYSENYKCIENNIFKSEDAETDKHMKKIKMELIENREKLKSI